MSATPVARDVVRSVADAEALEQPPLIVLEPLEALLDDLGIGKGPLVATLLGDGHSNVTYLLARGEDRVVLRRPPRPPYAPSAHDVLREARLMRSLRDCGLRVPEILAFVEDPEILGVPFVLVEYVAGHVISTAIPPALAGADTGGRIGEELIATLVAIHAADVTRPPLSALGKPEGYLERQLKRFETIWADAATRAIPDVDALALWLRENLPTSGPATIVHGDFRLGNMIFSARRPPRLCAVLDWELATIGDPIADVGYLCASWAEPGDEDDPVRALSGATRGPGFPSRAEICARYAELTGRDVSAMRWYEVFARWKSAVFLEANYGRYLAGTTHDPYYATLTEGIPRIAANGCERAGIGGAGHDRAHRSRGGHR